MGYIEDAANSDNEIEEDKARGCRDAIDAINAAMKDWDISYGIKVEIVEFYTDEGKKTVHKRMTVEDDFE